MFLPNETKVSPAWKLKFHRMKQQWNLQVVIFILDHIAL